MSNQPQAHVADERAAFESEMKMLRRPGVLNLSKDSHGDYADRDLFIGWRIWQAARAASTQGAAMAANPDEESAENGWRRLALQFDGHRMQALGYLKMMVRDAEKHTAAAVAFLRAGPLSGEAVLAERIARLAAGAPAETPKPCEGCGGNGEYEHKGADTVCRVCGGTGAAQRVPATDAQGQAEATDANDGELMQVLKFLMGSDLLEGVKFGDKHPTKAGINWWRLNLRAAMHGARRSPA